MSMASKERGSSILLYSKTAGVILGHPELRALSGEGDEDAGDTTTSTSGPPSVPDSLIRLISLEELMSIDDDEDASANDDVMPPGEEMGASSVEYITLNQLTAQEVRKEMFCNTCQTGFTSREEQVEHYQLDWHRYNLKRKLKGLTHVNQEDFEKISGDLSSISGSESDSAHSGKEDEPRPLNSELSQTPFIYFTTTDKNGQKLFAVYRSTVTRAKRGGAKVEAIKSLTNEQVWIVLMRSGGHFAGAVFRGHTVVAHKTFHRYTVRAKRGTAQSVRDAQGGGHGPKSAGASLRRYNETALAQETQDLVASWDVHVQEASAIFIRTPKYSRDILIGGGKAPFSKDDPRLRAIPFPTRRPTLSEVKRVHSQLASVYKVPLSALVGREQTAVRKSPRAKKKSSPNISARKEVVVAEAVADLELSDEGVNQNQSSKVTVEKSSDEKISKKKRRKKVTEKQEVFPDAVQKLLKTCCDPEDNAELLTEQLHSLYLHPLADYSPTVSQPHGESQEATNSPSPLVMLSSQLTEQVHLHPLADHSLPLSHKATLPVNTTEGEPIASQEATNELSPLDMLNSLWGGSTLLHVAAATGNVAIVSSLLLHGADPVVKDVSGKSPYLVSKDKPARDSFRRFMASHPSAYDYDSAHIPSPLTQDMEKERREKTNEKKKAQKKARKQREKEMKSVREVEKISSSREQKLAELSGREKRALAAERRLATQLPSDTAVVRAGRCCRCGQGLAGVMPFERLSYKYCSMTCLKQHREHLENNQKHT